MKKIRLVQWIVLIPLLCLCTGCKSKGKQERTPLIDDTIVTYDIGTLNAFTVDGQGILYTAEGELNVTLKQYDKEGNVITSHDFDQSMSGIMGMAANENKVYFTSCSHNDAGACVRLYSYDFVLDELKCLYEFNRFVLAKQIVFIDNRIYILGNTKFAANATRTTLEATYESKGEQLVYYSMVDNKVYEIGINTPISIAKSEDGTLLIHSYLDEEGFCMLEYTPDKDVAILTEQFDSYRFDRFAACNHGKQLIYTYNKNPRGLVLSRRTNLNEEAELYLDAPTADLFGVQFVNDDVYCFTHSNTIVRFHLNIAEYENRSLSYISSGFLADEPFGCGYTMNRVELEEDKFALKVLAQDNDYDLCVMDSTSCYSYNIRKNGVFYPLNEVAGINEYLDACFPYVREAATDEEGNIVILPIEVNIPCLLVNQACLAENHVNMKNNMTYEEFYEELGKMQGDLLDMTSLNSLVIYQTFFAQFFRQGQIINTDELKNKLTLFKTNHSVLPNVMNGVDFGGKFLYSYCRYAKDYESLIQSGLADIRAYSMPKLDESDKNLGVCTFIAINPNSKHLEEALKYIAEWIHYRMNRSDTPLFVQQPIPNEDSLKGSLYDLYQNGEITFYLDRDVYSNGFFEVVENNGNMDAYIEDTRWKLTTYFNE